MSKPLHQRLRGIAGDSLAGLLPEHRDTIREAAAEIEGHNEAFTAVVEHKHEAEQKAKDSERNHRHTLGMLANWRDLLRVLQGEHPADIRIKRALMGENPLVPAAWEKPIK
jgi:hypothetical protein